MHLRAEPPQIKLYCVPPHPVLLAGCNRSDVKQGKEMRCNMRQVNAFKRVHTLLDKASHNTIIKRETTTATSVFFFNEM